MEQPDRQGGKPTSALASAALLAALVIGAWWTGSAVGNGDPLGTALRFGASIALGLYYFGLRRFVQGQRVLTNRR